jgi:hypothetical protein
MVHRLAKPGQPLHAAGPAPLTATLRYRCECANNEVLTVSVVMSVDVNEEIFVWTMQQLWRDVQTEILQHTAKAK